MSVNMHMNGSPLFPSRVFAWTGLFKCQYLAPSAQSQLPLKRKQPAWRCRTLNTSLYNVYIYIYIIYVQYCWITYDPISMIFSSTALALEPSAIVKVLGQAEKRSIVRC